ncbi:hypothetical protein KC19_2G069400 [Ceratodon purpureus]|uniref:Uncharacterized protein n=1 Tax=Ceratodon purpureus TaxID=3225 RepID=A0A8T0ISS1_CERPU|nr:hypothetical protein KC19_2G069400 [Ceratodon purpureus]
MKMYKTPQKELEYIVVSRHCCLNITAQDRPPHIPSQMLLSENPWHRSESSQNLKSKFWRSSSRQDVWHMQQGFQKKKRLLHIVEFANKLFELSLSRVAPSATFASSSPNSWSL